MDTPIIHILIDEAGVARTVNRRVKVKMIVQKHLIGGDSLSAVADHYGIDLADVYAALTYYYDNKAEMDADFARQEADVKAIGVSGADVKARIVRRMSEHTDES